MKRFFPVLAMVLAVMMSACVKPNEPTQTRFSVLGDSYSSYSGTVDPETNDVWCYDSIGVTSAEQMWWYKVAVETGWALDKNNSFSGSLICNLNASNYYGPYSFIRRMDNLGNPDVIFVFGGTNDVWDGAEFGDYVYSDWTEEQLCEIRPALSYLFDNLCKLYPKATVYFMIDMDLCSGGADEETKQLFFESVRHIASRYNVRCIDLFDIHKSWWHPNARGHEDIARQVMETLEVDFNV